MTTLPLPDYLSDLRFSLAGKTLALHPVSWADGMYAVDTQAPEGSWGLFVDLEQRRGKHRDSQTVEEYRDGRIYGHVRGLHDHVGTPMEFSDWLRKQLAKHIHKLVRGHIDETYYRLKNDERATHVPSLAAMCRDIAALPALPEIEPFGCQTLCDALTAISNAHNRGTMKHGEALIVRTFLDDYGEPPFRKDLREKTIQQAFVLLPDVVPGPILDYLEARAQAEVDKYSGGEPLTVENAATLGRLLQMQPVHLRPIYNGLISPLCNTADLCFAMATTLGANPSQAAAHAQRGLQLSPTHAGLRRFTEILDGNPNAFAEAAAKAKQYEALIPKVLNEANTPDLKGNDKKLLDTQAWLNRFWKSVLPPRNDPSWEQVMNILCAQDRFKARGSEAYLYWCRHQGRNVEGAEYFLSSLQDIELTQLQHLSDWHCEAYLAQGLSCMLDTQHNKHIEQALQVIDQLEPVLTWKGQSVFYALACVTSRAGQIKRALGYAKRSVELGHAVKPMFTDPDFTNLMENPWAELHLRKLLK